jgi:hypothetical protein
VCGVKKIAKLRHGNPFGPNVCVTYSAEDEGAAAGAAGVSMLVMTGPPPRGPVEAGCAVAIFEDARPLEMMRYFTSEAPMEPSFPQVVAKRPTAKPQNIFNNLKGSWLEK